MASAVDVAAEPVQNSSLLMAAAKHIGTKCRNENVAFLKCKRMTPTPRNASTKYDK